MVPRRWRCGLYCADVKTDTCEEWLQVVRDSCEVSFQKEQKVTGYIVNGLNCLN